MIRDRSPVWLAGPGRFATLRSGGALAVAVLIACLVLAAWFVPAADDGATGIAAGTDPGLHAVIVEGVRAGGDYYGVTAQASRAGGAPLTPFTAVRLPTLTMVQAVLPDLATLALLAAVAVATALTWHRAIGRWFVRPAVRGTALFLLAGGMVAFVQPGFVRVQEIWAGLLIAWSLGLRREDRWIEAAAIGLCAMLIRETAVLYGIVMLGAALAEGRRREAAGWGVALFVFVVLLSLHARAAGMAAGPLDTTAAAAAEASGPHAPGRFAEAMARSTVLALLPWWIGAPVAMLALVGWAGAPGPLGLRAMLTFGGCMLASVLVASAGVVDWTLAAAPAFLVGLAFVPDGARDLRAALLDRRRVRVQRIVR